MTNSGHEDCPIVLTKTDHYQDWFGGEIHGSFFKPRFLRVNSRIGSCLLCCDQSSLLTRQVKRARRLRMSCFTQRAPFSSVERQLPFIAFRGRKGLVASLGNRMSIESKEQWRLWRSFLNHRTPHFSRFRRGSSLNAVILR